jgi:hypothetical protein
MLAHRPPRFSRRPCKYRDYVISPRRATHRRATHPRQPQPTRPTGETQPPTASDAATSEPQELKRPTRPPSRRRHLSVAKDGRRVMGILPQRDATPNLRPQRLNPPRPPQPVQQWPLAVASFKAFNPNPPPTTPTGHGLASPARDSPPSYAFFEPPRPCEGRLADWLGRAW